MRILQNIHIVIIIIISLFFSFSRYDGTDLMLRFLSWWHFGYNNAFLCDDSPDHYHSVGTFLHDLEA